MMMNTEWLKEKKGALITMCGAFVLGAGMIHASAAPVEEKATPKVESEQPAVAETEKSLLVQEEGFETSHRYSTDGGKTWHDGLPSEEVKQTADLIQMETIINAEDEMLEGVTVSSGSFNALEDEAEAPEELQMMLVNEDGTIFEAKSTDGGKTWDKELPDYVDVDEVNGTAEIIVGSDGRTVKETKSGTEEVIVK